MRGTVSTSVQRAQRMFRAKRAIFSAHFERDLVKIERSEENSERRFVRGRFESALRAFLREHEHATCTTDVSRSADDFFRAF